MAMAAQLISEALPPAFRFHVGSGSQAEPRGPETLGAGSSVGGLPTELEDWDFEAAAESCPAGVEVVPDAP